MKFPAVILYSFNGCKRSAAVREFLAANDVPFSDRNIGEDAAALKELARLVQEGIPTIPTVVVGTAVISGFDREKLATALGLDGRTR